jgi:anaerobic carbon-monoxide dehydrogenase iron sulfur subunit
LLVKSYYNQPVRKVKVEFLEGINLENAVYVDMEKCVACYTCKMQCALQWTEKHDLFEASRERPHLQSRIRIKQVGDYTMPMMCRHCEVNPCIEACPTEAIHKRDDGVVVINPTICIGCQSCIKGCPLGAIYFDVLENVAIKCEQKCSEPFEERDFCCVESCPVGALVYGDWKKITKERV